MFSGQLKWNDFFESDIAYYINNYSTNLLLDVRSSKNRLQIHPIPLASEPLFQHLLSDEYKVKLFLYLA